MSYLLTIARVIHALEGVDDAAVLYMQKGRGDGVKLFPVSPHAYRGIPEDVAFDSEERTGTVGEFKELLAGVLGKWFHADNGKNYLTGHSAPLHHAKAGGYGDELSLVYMKPVDDGWAYVINLCEPDF